MSCFNEIKHFKVAVTKLLHAYNKQNIIMLVWVLI